jgi:hypothetical protein
MDDLQTNAVYKWNEVRGYRLPLDAWTTNPEVEWFLQREVKRNGIATLTAKYGMQCVPRSSVAGCTDCYTCTRTFREWLLGASTVIPGFKCLDYGEVSVHAEIGPGSTVAAMTYWKTSPEVHKKD